MITIERLPRLLSMLTTSTTASIIIASPTTLATNGDGFGVLRMSDPSHLGLNGGAAIGDDVGPTVKDYVTCAQHCDRAQLTGP